MPARPTSTGDNADRPRFGKDHLNLADWRISVATYQQRRKRDGERIDYAEYVIARQDRTCQKVILEAPSRVGLPTAGDEDVLIALLALAKQQHFASDVVRFVPSRLMAIMRWPIKQKSYERLEKALKRLTALTVTYKLAWYSRKLATVQPILVTGILAESKLLLRRGRRASNAIPDSYVQWTKNFYTSLTEGNLTDLDLDLYFTWERPTTKHLHRHLNKVWHSGRKPKLYERDLKELACGHLGMTNNKDVKRNVGRAIEELERQGYLVPTEKTVRYRKIRPGVWRVRMELHPDHYRVKTTGAGEWSKQIVSSEQGTDAMLLVCDYHRHRFGREMYTPKVHELNHAKMLCTSHDIALLRRLVPEVAKTVETAYRAKDCHFGAAVPYFERTLQDRADKERYRIRQAAQDSNQADTHAALNSQQQKRQHLRIDRLAKWKELSDEQKTGYYDQAIQHTTSDAVRSRLCCHRDFTNPATEVLAVMAANLGDAIGESS